MTEIHTLSPANILTLAEMLTRADAAGKGVRVAWDGGLKVKVGEDCWTPLLSRPEQPAAPAAPASSPLVGKTIAAVTEQRMVGRDTYKDEVRWTETTLHFTDGTKRSFGESDGDVYDPRPLVEDDDEPEQEVCGAEAKRGTGTGACFGWLDEHGTCTRAAWHI